MNSAGWAGYAKIGATSELREQFEASNAVRNRPTSLQGF